MENSLFDEAIFKIKNLGFEPLFCSIDNRNEKIKVRCNEGHIINKIYHNFISSPVCRECKKYKRYVDRFNLVKRIIESAGGKMISVPSGKTMPDFEFVCSCGTVSVLKANQIKSSKGFCPNCRYQRTAKTRMFSLDEIEKIFDEEDCVFVGNKYSHKIQLEFICKCGNRDKRSLNGFRKSPMCHECSKNLRIERSRKPYALLCSFFEENGCILLTKENEKHGRRDRINFICSCGTIVNKTLSNYYSCPSCLSCAKTRDCKSRYEDVKTFIEQNNCSLITSKEEYINKNHKLIIKCSCGENFSTSFLNFDHENKRRCNKCSHDANSGENHVRWKGGPNSDEEKFRHSAEYAGWRKSIFKRDEYRCVRCGEEGNIHAHHILNFSDNFDLRLEVENGITLCNQCHNPSIIGSFHNVYGTKNNTLDQLIEYIHI